ncbi:hypothetical protein vBSenI1_71 [Salmonella phage vB_Sen_I1]|uniref:Uncharacterized protein n=1 Tax=Salmonella phage vB_Sen_I1 TaxID=2723910 RepID=A0A7L5CBG6_9CAUD|nr:hypothetical protein vBSenI1_71 [Salmonella phage vB_Sen_I1]
MVFEIFYKLCITDRACEFLEGLLLFSYSGFCQYTIQEIKNLVYLDVFLLYTNYK